MLAIVCHRHLSLCVTLPAGGPTAGRMGGRPPADRVRGQSDGWHCTAGQYGYVLLGWHLVTTVCWSRWSVVVKCLTFSTLSVAVDSLQPWRIRLTESWWCQERNLSSVVSIILTLKLATVWWLNPRGSGVPPFHLCFFLVHSLPHLWLFFTFPFFPFFIHFTYFILLSIRSLSTRIVPLRFQAGGHGRRPNLSLFCSFCVICTA